MALAREAAPHIRKQGEKILPKSMKEQSSDGKSKMDGVIEVAASGLKGRFQIENGKTAEEIRCVFDDI